MLVSPLTKTPRHRENTVSGVDVNINKDMSGVICPLYNKRLTPDTSARCSCAQRSGGGLRPTPPPRNSGGYTPDTWTQSELPKPQTGEKTKKTCDTIEFFYECQPPTATAQQRRHAGRKTYQTDRIKHASAVWRSIFELYKPQAPFCGPLSLSLALSWPHTGKTRRMAQSGQIPAVPKTTKPDLDNICKLILDAMTQAGYWLDDSQVCRLTVAKFHADIPGVYVEVSSCQQ